MNILMILLGLLDVIAAIIALISLQYGLGTGFASLILALLLIKGIWSLASSMIM